MAITPTVAAAAPAVTSILQVIVTEVLMLVSGVVGWFMHSALVTSTVAKIKAEVAKVTPNVPAAQ